MSLLLVELNLRCILTTIDHFQGLLKWLSFEEQLRGGIKRIEVTLMLSASLEYRGYL